jgi:hypothetical protein
MPAASRPILWNIVLASNDGGQASCGLSHTFSTASCSGEVDGWSVGGLRDPTFAGSLHPSIRAQSLRVIAICSEGSPSSTRLQAILTSSRLTPLAEQCRLTTHMRFAAIPHAPLPC